jgi:hypothetical protein
MRYNVKSNLFFLIISVVISTITTAQKVIPLYKDSIPNSIMVPDEEKTEMGKDSILRISKVSRPFYQCLW